MTGHGEQMRLNIEKGICTLNQAAVLRERVRVNPNIILRGNIDSYKEYSKDEIQMKNRE